jgi:hypothetical protein
MKAAFFIWVHPMAFEPGYLLCLLQRGQQQGMLEWLLFQGFNVLPDASLL